MLVNRLISNGWRKCAPDMLLLAEATRLMLATGSCRHSGNAGSYNTIKGKGLTSRGFYPDIFFF